MSNTVYSTGDLGLMGRIVSAQGFRELSRVDKVAWPEVAVLIGAYGAFALSSYLYLVGIFPYLLTFTISGVALYAVFTPLHDATHRSASSDPGINELIGNVAAFFLVPGFTTALYRYLHLEHHRHTGEVDADPDELFVSAWLPLRVMSWFFPDVRWIVWYFKRRQQRPPSERRAYWLGLAFSIAWHVAWLSSSLAWEFFVLWMLPQRLGLGLVLYLFAYIQHPDGIEQKHNLFQATRMIRGGGISRHLMLGQSQHLMHHLFPSVPFYRYHLAWAKGGRAVADYGTAWQWPLTPMQTPGLRREVLLDVVAARVLEARATTSEVMTYVLSPVHGGSFPSAEPGAHIDVHLGDGMVRQYSLCGDPADRTHYQIAVKQEINGRGGSKKIHQTVRAGDVMKIGGPRNLFPLDLSACRYTLISGGIGITPLMAMAYALTNKQLDFQFHVCARSAAAVPFRDELERSAFAPQVHLHLDDQGEQQRFSAARLAEWEPGALLYLCGPTPFMQWVRQLARQRGWPDHAVHTESFATQGGETAQNRAFDIDLARSGKTVHVASDQSALEVLQANQVAVAASCTQGLCGACLSGVVSGEVDHRDHCLTDAEKQANNVMALCVSRAVGERIVIDL